MSGSHIGDDSRKYVTRAQIKGAMQQILELGSRLSRLEDSMRNAPGPAGSEGLRGGAGGTEARAGKQTESINHRLQTLEAGLARAVRDLNVLCGKLDELEDSSVDIAEVRDSFAKRKDLHRQSQRIAALEKRQMRLEQAQKRAGDEVRKLQQRSMAELAGLLEKLNRVSKSAVKIRMLDRLSRRVEGLEDLLAAKSAGLAKRLREQEKHLAEVFLLKKDFVTRESLGNLKKQIRLIVSSMKELARK